MPTALAKLMTAVDLTLIAPPEDPAEPIVHEVTGPGGRIDMIEVRRDENVYLQISAFRQVGFDISERIILFEAYHTDGDIRISSLKDINGHEEQSFIASAVCSITKSLFLLKKMDYYLSHLAGDMSAITVTDDKRLDRLERDPFFDQFVQTAYVRFPLAYKNLKKMTGCRSNATLWDLI